MLFLGLHGLNVEEHVIGWKFFFVNFFFFFFLLIGSQGLETSGSTPFGWRISLTLTFVFAFLFLLLDFLQGGCSLNETTMCLSIDVLTTGRTVYVPTTMTFDVFETHLEFETSHTFTSSEADGGLDGVSGVSSDVFGTMGLEIGVAEKVSSTGMATLGGFETALVSVEKIRTIFLETGAALEFGFTAMTSLVVVWFEAVGTHITGPEKPWETGDDIVVAFSWSKINFLAEGGPKLLT